MVIYVDIDNTICHSHKNAFGEWDYSLSEPRYDQIEKINKLHNEGHEIVYWTARGSLTGKDWEDLTRKQLSEWGVKFHAVKFHKPFYDIFIDDKNINVKDLLNFKPENFK